MGVIVAKDALALLQAIFKQRQRAVVFALGLPCMLNALSQGNVKDVVDSVVTANCKILCSGIEKVCAFDSLP